MMIEDVLSVAVFAVMKEIPSLVAEFMLNSSSVAAPASAFGCAAKNEGAQMDSRERKSHLCEPTFLQEHAQRRASSSGADLRTGRIANDDDSRHGRT